MGDFGGVARHVLDVAITGIPGWRIVVLAPAGPLVDACTEAGVATITGELGPAHGLRRSVRTLRGCVDRLRPAVVHTHLSHADITAGFAFASRRGPTLVSTEHGISADPALYQSSRLRSSVMTRVHNLRLRSFDGIIAVSRSTRDQIVSRWKPPARLPIEVIANGVDPWPPAGTPRAAGLRIATLSRLSHEKRLEATLRAFAEILLIEPDARLTMAGEGPDRAALEALCTEIGISDAVEFPGFVDSCELLGRTDVIVQLSAWENCSYTLLDALAAGVGVVATPVGGNPEILPPFSLVGSQEPRAIAAAVLEQALAPHRRSMLSPDWPNRAGMTSAISEFYDRVTQ